MKKKAPHKCVASCVVLQFYYSPTVCFAPCLPLADLP